MSSRTVKCVRNRQHTAYTVRRILERRLSSAAATHALWSHGLLLRLSGTVTVAILAIADVLTGVFSQYAYL